MTSKITKIERYKKEINLKDYYAKLDLLKESSLSEADRFYLKNFGIYNSVLKPKHFMLRLRIPGGRVTLENLSTILKCAKEIDAKITLTSRAQIELQSISLKSAIKAHKLLFKEGISTFGTLTDNIRNIVTHPLDGIAKDAKIETIELILQMQEEFIKIENLSLVPRKFNTAIMGNITNFEPFWANDCYFCLAKKDETLGFKLFLGGKNTDFAQDMDIFVTKDEVVSLYIAVIKTYIKYGNRASRTKARLHYLLSELKVEGFKEALKEFYPKELTRGGEILEKGVLKSDFYTLKNGTYAYCYRSDFAEVKIDEFEHILEYADKNGCEIRLGVDQNIYILGLKEKSINLNSKALAKDAKVCVGLKYCGMSIYDTKESAHNINYSRLNALNIKTALSGCLKGCARHISADIGFVGIRTNLYGEKEFAVRLYLGALHNGAKPARLIFWAVPLRYLNKMLDVILDEFEQSRYKTFEEFSLNTLNNFSNEFLALYFLKKLNRQKQAPLHKQKESKEPSELYNEIKELERAIYNSISL